MSRLYYESNTTPPAGVQQQAGGGPTAPTSEYAEKISKLIPAEVLVGFLAIVGLLPMVEPATVREPVGLAAFLLCVLLTPLYLNAMAESGKPKAAHLILSTAAFVFWAYATAGEWIYKPWHYPGLGSVLLVGFTLVSGLFRLSK